MVELEIKWWYKPKHKEKKHSTIVSSSRGNPLYIYEFGLWRQVPQSKKYIIIYSSSSNQASIKCLNLGNSYEFLFAEIKYWANN